MAAPSGLVGVFDRAAATYDAVGVPFFGPVADGLLAELGPRPGERVLDVGCGRGAVLSRAARLVGPTGGAVGVDLAPEMVRRTALDLAPLSQVSVRLDDASDPGVAAASFDVVASSLVVPFLPDAAAALGRWTRLLVAGGRLGVTTFAEDAAVWRAVDHCFETVVPAAPGEPHRPADAPEDAPGDIAGDIAEDEAAPEPWDSDDGMESLLADAGLTDVRTVRRTVGVRFRDLDQLVAFTWSTGQRAGWEAVDVDARPRVRQAIGEALVPLGLGADGLVVEQPIRFTLGRRPG